MLEALYWAAVLWPGVYANLKKRRDAQVITILTIVLAYWVYAAPNVWLLSGWAFLMTWGYINLSFLDMFAKKESPKDDGMWMVKDYPEDSGVDDDVFEKLYTKDLDK